MCKTQRQLSFSDISTIALMASSYTPDQSSPPFLLVNSIDMNNLAISLTYSEPLHGMTFLLSYWSIISDQHLPESVTLTEESSSHQPIEDGLEITISLLSRADANAIKVSTSLGNNVSNTYISAIEGMVLHHGCVPSAPISVAEAIQAEHVTPPQ